MLAYFGAVTDALACALKVQTQFAVRNQELSEEAKCQFRIGINAGDVFIDTAGIRKGLYGNTTNVAARLEALAEPGGVCISDAVRAAVGSRLPLEFEFIGEHTVKNIPSRCADTAFDCGRARSPLRRVRDLPPPASRARCPSPFRDTSPSAGCPSRARYWVGRDEELRQLDQAWMDPGANIVSVVAWAGVGKSTLVTHWLRRVAHDHYRGAARVYAWSFYLQGTVDRMAAADEFVASTLSWFGDPNPNAGSARDKGERLAKLIQQQRTLLILDGLEPLQCPPGPEEGRLVDSGLHALLCELASTNPGLCILTTRLPVSDLQDFHDSHRQINLKCLSPTDGANLLRAHKIQGSDAELQQASEEFGGHCLALTLLANYLNDAFEGGVVDRRQIDALQEDIRYGGHARRVLSSYSDWMDDAAEREVLRIMGLFDRPASGAAIRALRALRIPELTEHISQPDDATLGRVISRLRRVGLLAERDPHSPEALDTHPLVRQFFREQLQMAFPDAWRQGNECLFRYFKELGPQYPETLAEMEVLFQAMSFGCHSGLHRQALHEIYLPRIMRGQSHYAANVLGARGSLLTVLANFFEARSWADPVTPGPDREGLEPRDQLTVLEHVRMFLTAAMGYAPPGIVPCYTRIKSLCHKLGETASLYSVLTSDWMRSLVTESLGNTRRRADEILRLARDQNDPAMLVGAYRTLSDVTYFQGEFRDAKTFAEEGIAVFEERGSTSRADEISAPVVTCLCFDALALWQLGWPDRALPLALQAHKNGSRTPRNAAPPRGSARSRWSGPDSAASSMRATSAAHKLVKLSIANGFRFWLAGAHVQLGWARALLGSAEESLSLITQGIQEWRATGAELIVPYWLAMTVEAHHAVGKMAQCLPMIMAARESADTRGELWWKADLLRLKGVYLVEEGRHPEGEHALLEALGLARHQGSASMELRAALELGRLWLERDQGDEARKLVAPVYEAISHSEYTADLKAAHDLLASL